MTIWLRILVNSAEDKFRVNLPIPLVKMGPEMGMKMPQISGDDYLKDIDFAQLIKWSKRTYRQAG